MINIGSYSAPQLPVSLEGCPASWNLTDIVDSDVETIEESWWTHLDIYELSYMWYSGVSCCMVVILGSILSLLPYFQMENYPDNDLFVPASEVIKLKFQHLTDSLNVYCLFLTGFVLLLARETPKYYHQNFQPSAEKTEQQKSEECGCFIKRWGKR